MYIPKEMMESQTVALITNRTFTISEYEEDEIFSRHPFGPFTEILYLTREFSDYSTMLSEHHPALIFKQSSNQQFIPSIIHQIWIGGKPP